MEEDTRANNQATALTELELSLLMPVLCVLLQEQGEGEGRDGVRGVGGAHPRLGQVGHPGAHSAPYHLDACLGPLLHKSRLLSNVKEGLAALSADGLKPALDSLPLREAWMHGVPQAMHCTVSTPCKPLQLTRSGR